MKTSSSDLCISSKSDKLKIKNSEICRNRQISKFRISRFLLIARTQHSYFLYLSESTKLKNLDFEICRNHQISKLETNNNSVSFRNIPSRNYITRSPTSQKPNWNKSQQDNLTTLRDGHIYYCFFFFTHASALVSQGEHTCDDSTLKLGEPGRAGELEIKNIFIALANLFPATVSNIVRVALEKLPKYSKIIKRLVLSSCVPSMKSASMWLRTNATINWKTNNSMADQSKTFMLPFIAVVIKKSASKPCIFRTRRKSRKNRARRAMRRTIGGNGSPTAPTVSISQKSTMNISNQFHADSTHLAFKTINLNTNSAVKAMPKMTSKMMRACLRPGDPASPPRPFPPPRHPAPSLRLSTQPRFPASPPRAATLPRRAAPPRSRGAAPRLAPHHHAAAAAPPPPPRIAFFKVPHIIFIIDYIYIHLMSQIRPLVAPWD